MGKALEVSLLGEAVRQVRADLEIVLRNAEEVGLQPANRHMLNARQLLVSLRILEHECRIGIPSRRAWSHGQAAVPVLSSTLNGIARRTGRTQPNDIHTCRRSLAHFSDALIAFAEGREPTD